MKARFVCIYFVLPVLISGCSSTTLFKTSPNGAEIYVDGQRKGVTPYFYSDTKVAFSSTPVLFRKDGYQDLSIVLKRNEKADGDAILTGILFWIPCLWFMEYNPVHSYDLEPLIAFEENKAKDADRRGDVVSNHDSLNYSRRTIPVTDTVSTLQNNINYNDTISSRSIDKSITSNESDGLKCDFLNEPGYQSYQSSDLSTMNSEQLNNSLKNARIMEGIGIGATVAGSICMGSALIIALGGALIPLYDYETDTDPAMKLANGLLIGGSIAIGTGIPLILAGIHRKHQIKIFMQRLELNQNSSALVGLGLTLKF